MKNEKHKTWEQPGNIFTYSTLNHDIAIFIQEFFLFWLKRYE